MMCLMLKPLYEKKKFKINVCVSTDFYKPKYDVCSMHRKSYYVNQTLKKRMEHKRGCMG